MGAYEAPEIKTVVAGLEKKFSADFSGNMFDGETVVSAIVSKSPSDITVRNITPSTQAVEFVVEGDGSVGTTYDLDVKATTDGSQVLVGRCKVRQTTIGAPE
jgi:hypothetical protein